MTEPKRIAAAASLGLISLLLLWVALCPDDSPPPHEFLVGYGRSTSETPAGKPQLALGNQNRVLEHRQLASEVISPPQTTSSTQKPDHDSVPRLSIHLLGPRNLCSITPLNLIGKVDLLGKASALVSSTNLEGRAEFEVRPHLEGEGQCWADLGFPSLGFSAKLVNEDQEQVTLAMVTPSYIDIELCEQDGSALCEPTVVEIRVPTAQAPGHRWHTVAMHKARGRTTVQAGIDLIARATTSSGRTVSAEVRAPSGPDRCTTCKLVLGSHGNLSLPILTSQQEALANHAVQLTRAQDRRPVSNVTLRTDTSGLLTFRLTKEQQSKSSAKLILMTTVDGSPQYAEVYIGPHHLQAGGCLPAVTLQPLYELFSGTVTDDLSQEVLVGVRFALELTSEAVDPRQIADQHWQSIAVLTSKPNGTITAFELPPPHGCQLRLRALDHPRSKAMQVVPGRFDLELAFERAQSHKSRLKRLIRRASQG